MTGPAAPSRTAAPPGRDGGGTLPRGLSAEALFSKRRLPAWRLAALLGVHVLFGLHVLHWWLRRETLAPLEFSEALHTLHAGVITAGFLFLLATMLLTGVFGRFFCGWGCHILALQDGCSWLLGRLGIRPRPVRSRVLVWIPVWACAYLYAWPSLHRAWLGLPHPSLRIQGDWDGWGSFVTQDLLRAMPGLWVSLLTFLVCGGLIVFLLGSRSFCTTVCPYGVFFGFLDRLAPGKITLTGACENCGICTAVCKSGVKVIQEIRATGSVADPNCLKSMDCVASCPNGALGFKFMKPAILGRSGAKAEAGRGSGAATRPQARLPGPGSRAFSLPEEIALLAAFAAALPVYRGLYDTLGLLLSMALAVCLAYSLVLAVRILRGKDTGLAGMRLVALGRRFPAAYGVLAAAGAFLLLTLHSGYVRYHTHRAQGGYQAVFASPARAPSADGIEAALEHGRKASRAGMFPIPSLLANMAALHHRAGRADSAEAGLRRLLGLDGDNLQARLRLGQSLDARGLHAEAAEEFSRALVPDGRLKTRADRAARSMAYVMLAKHQVRSGNRPGAIAAMESAVRDNPADYASKLNLALLLRQNGDFGKARAVLRSGLREAPPRLDFPRHLADLEAEMASRGPDAPVSRGSLEASP